MFLILFGYALKRFRLVPETTWAGMEKLAYYFLFPALLVSNLARQELSEFPWLAMLAVVVGTSVAAAVALVFWHQQRKHGSRNSLRRSRLHAQGLEIPGLAAFHHRMSKTTQG